MKKLFYSLFALTLSVMTFTSCEDVPAPYDLPTENGGGGGNTDPAIAPEGSGTVEDPYNVAAAVQYIKNLEADVESTEDVSIEGIVESVTEEYGTSFGNATFYISDDGSSTGRLYIYRCLYLGNKEYKSGDNIKEGDKVVIRGKVVNFRGSTPETVQKKAYLYSLNGKQGDDTQPEEPAGDPKGSGTLTDPFNSVAANNFAGALGADEKTSRDIYIQGKIVSIAKNGQFNEQYGNATFYISDDGKSGGQFYVFRTLYLGNRKWTKGDMEVKVGDDVIICGKLTNYMGNTPETVANESYIYSLNGKTGEGDQPSDPSEPQTTIDNPYTVSQALDVISKLGEGATTDTEEYTKGKINKIDEISAQYGNATYYITDGEKEIKVFRGKYLEQASFTSEDQLKEGDEVIVCGKLQRYIDKNGVETPEIAQGNYIVSLNNSSEQPEQPDYPTSGDNGSFENWDGNTPVNWVTESTAGNAKLSKGDSGYDDTPCVIVKGSSSANQRLGYKELYLKAGNYMLSFWVAGGLMGGSVRPGYVKVTDGKVGSYIYGDYVDVPGPNDGWQQINHQFTLDEDGVYCIVIMNSKNPGQDVYIDHVVLVRDNDVIIQ